MPTSPRTASPRARVALDLARPDAELPTEFRLFASGSIETTNGTFLFDEQSAKSVLAEAAAWGNEFPIDYAHAMVGGIAIDPAEAGKAAGWFTPAVRDGELWATAVSWTPAGAQYLRNREYRYISPAFDADDENRVLRLVNVALTNLPATHGLTPLVAHDVRARVAQRLSTSPTRTTTMDPEALKALKAKAASAFAAMLDKMSPEDMTAFCESGAMPGAAEPADPEEKALATEALSITGAKTPREAIGALKALSTAHGPNGELAKRLAKLESDTAASAHATFVSEQIAKGNVPPALKQWALSQSRESVEGYVKHAPKVIVHTGTEGGEGDSANPTPAAKVVSLSQDDKYAAKQLGVSEDKFLTLKQERASRAQKVAG